MRCIVTGVDSGAGRSRVDHETVIDTDGVQTLWSAVGGLPSLGIVAQGSDELEIGVAPGGIRSIVAHLAPHQESIYHWTRTLDVDTVLVGSVELLLDESAVLLMRGDCAVVTGVRHGWRAGPDGCLLAAVQVGVAG
jgi:hypothetical protein